MSLPVTHNLDSDGVGWIIFNDPAGRVNLLNQATQAALAAAIESLSVQPVKAVVVAGEKTGVFLAGADLRALGRLPDEAAAEEFSRAGQALFARLENFRAPVVCAIHGACAGGGFELALACHWRVASDAKETVVGLTEVGLGIIPCWGGCARLSRLIGPVAAGQHILSATLISAAAARAAGLVDEILPAAEWKTGAKAAALRLAAMGRPARSEPPPAPAGFFDAQREAAAVTVRHLPAPGMALDILEQGATRSLAEALALEPVGFGRLATGEVARNLIHVFFLKEAARKRTVDPWFPPGGPASAAPTRIGVIGAGVIGSAVAQQCAMQGLGVLMFDREAPALKRGVEVIRELFRGEEARGVITSAGAHRAMGGIGITTDLADLDYCDLVLESVVEQVDVKQEVFLRLAGVVSPQCVLASASSTWPIEEATAGVSLPERTVGLHFFHPVAARPLVEIVVGPRTDRVTAERALAFVRKLGKTAVICGSAPGFFVTRVLAFYLNEACRLWEQGVPTEAIDGALCAWGWPRGPLRLIDEAGLEVTAQIFARMQAAFPDRFRGTPVCAKMLAAGWRGHRSGASVGFYVYDGVREKVNVTAAQFAGGPSATPDAGAIQDRLMGVMLAEARGALHDGVVKSADDADLALLLGADFPAFRGGLLRHAEKSGAFRP